VDFNFGPALDVAVHYGPRTDRKLMREWVAPRRWLEAIVPIRRVSGSDGEIPWGEAAEGVQIRAEPEKLVWKEGEAPAFTVAVRNSGPRTFRRAKICRAMMLDSQTYGLGKAKAEISPLRPGARYDNIRIVLDGRLLAKDGPTGDGRRLLPPGRHVIRIHVEAIPDAKDQKPVVTLTDPVDFQIAEREEGEAATGASIRRHRMSRE